MKEHAFKAGLSAEGNRVVIVHLTTEEKAAVDKFIAQLSDNNPITDEDWCGSVWISDAPEK